MVEHPRFERNHKQGIFARMMAGLAAEHGDEKTVMIDAPHLKAHRLATSLGGKRGGVDDCSLTDRVFARQVSREVGRTKAGMNTKLHALCDSHGRALNLFVTAGQVSDYIGAEALLSSLPDVDWLLGDRGYNADCSRDALKDK